MFHKVIRNSYEIFYLLKKVLQSYNIFPKSKKGNEKWTFLKMSNFGTPNKVSKNTVFSHCDRDALNYIFCKIFL